MQKMPIFHQISTKTQPKTNLIFLHLLVTCMTLFSYNVHESDIGFTKSVYLINNLTNKSLCQKERLDILRELND